MKGETTQKADTSYPVDISIHSPMKGETTIIFRGNESVPISIHSPMKGETAPNDTVYRETDGTHRGVLSLFISISLLF
ncbi:Uncharacterised protein [Streptococcus pyogenes]|nr:Uncharacterised protein [Streptococcus pyogenes]VHF43615.1 Uncharacterised protein [Streptococcus pyogenes]